MSEATQTQPEGPFAATPREELERQIMCPTVPKTEREWWAADEIERLKAELLERDAVWLPEKDAEIERLRAALLHTLACLEAAIGLLERGGKAAKKAAASDTMFDIMLKDYRTQADKARAALKEDGDD